MTERGPNPLEKPSFAPSERAEHPYGVLYQGEYQNAADGTGVAIRLNARALASAGIPVVLKSFSGAVLTRNGMGLEPLHQAGLDPAVAHEVAPFLQTSISHAIPVIKHAVIQSGEKLGRMLMRGAVGPLDATRKLLAAQQAIYANTIVYSVWERSTIPEDVARHLRKIGECWVPCEQNAEALRQAGIERVQVMPHPYDPVDQIVLLSQRKPKRDGWLRFYSIGRWEPRKAYHELIGCFLKAFTPKHLASLTIKFSGGNWSGYPTPQESLVHWSFDAAVQAQGWNLDSIGQRVKLIGHALSRANLIGLHYTHNIYVCSSHGEAWCLPAFEAKLAGNRMVHVPFGGTADFAARDDVAVPFELGPVPASYGWPGAQWANWEPAALVRALRHVEPPLAFQVSEELLQRYTLPAVGQKMRARVIEVARRGNSKAVDYYEGIEP